MLSIGPGYDPTLIGARPVARPDAVPTLPAQEGSWTKPEDWLAGLRGADEHLARALPGGWTVVGEHTELRRIDDKMPGERRTQSLGVLGQLRPDDHADSRRHLQIADLDRLPALAGATPLVYHWDPSYRGPSTWLTLHPRLAVACGWQREPAVVLGWQDDEGPVVRTLWWRTGWLYSARWPDGQDVGEGWLVLLQERALPRLADVLRGEPTLAWQVQRDFLASDQSSDQRSGTRRSRS